MKKFLWVICFFVVLAAAGICFLFSSLCPSVIQYEIGCHFYYGIGVATNHKMAYDWVKKSAEKGGKNVREAVIERVKIMIALGELR